MEPHWAIAQFDRAERLVQLVDREREMVAKMRCTDFTDKWKKYDEDRANRVRELERELEEMKKQRDELVEQLGLCKHQNLVNAAEIKRQTEQNNHLSKRCNMIECVIERTERDRSGSKKCLLDLRDEMEDVRGEVGTLVEQLHKTTATLRKLQVQYIAEKKESEELVASKDALIEQLRMESEAGKMREATLRFATDCYNEKINDLEQQIKKQREKVEQLCMENGKLDEENATLKNSLADTLAQGNSLRQLLSASEDEKLKLMSAMRELESEKQNRIDAKDSEICKLSIERNQLLAKIESHESAKAESEAIIGRLNQQVREVQCQAACVQEQLENAFSSASVERENLNRRIAEVEDSRVGLEREVNAARELLAKALSENEQTEARINLLTGELSCGLKREEDLKERATLMEKECMELRAQVYQSTIDLDNEKIKAKETEQQLVTSMSALETEITSLRVDLGTTKSELLATNMSLEAANMDREATKTDLKATKTDLEAAKADLEVAKKDLEAAEAKLEAVKAELEVTKTDLDAAKTDLESVVANSAKVQAELAASEKVKEQEIERLKADCDRMLETMNEFEKQAGILRTNYVKMQRENSQLKHLVQEQQVAICALNRAVPKSTSSTQKADKASSGKVTSPKRATDINSWATTPDVPVQRSIPSAPRAKPKLDATFDEDDSEKQAFLFREQYRQIFAERLSPKRKSTNSLANTAKRGRI